LRKLCGLTGSKFAVSDVHSCLISDRATVKCWGFDWYLGTGVGSGATIPRSKMTSVHRVTGATQIEIDRTSCAKTSKGEAWCWGNNIQGAAGGAILAEPEKVPLSGVSDIAVSEGGHACAVSNQRAACWGNNTWGQIGNGTTARVTTPAWVPVPGQVVDVGVNRERSCAVTTDSRVWCWGYDGASSFLSPVELPDLAGTSSVTIGQDWEVCGKKPSGVVICSQGSIHGFALPTTEIPTVTGAVEVNGNCALMPSGWVNCWTWGGGGATPFYPIGTNNIFGKVVKN
jgi:alpha-tubulin suppressor-like RCC1 family protein